MKAYAKPVVLWGAALAGLVLALVGDGWADGVGVALLAAPAVAVVVLSARGTS